MKGAEEHGGGEGPGAGARGGPQGSDCAQGSPLEPGRYSRRPEAWRDLSGGAVSRRASQQGRSGRVRFALGGSCPNSRSARERAGEVGGGQESQRKGHRVREP